MVKIILSFSLSLLLFISSGCGGTAPQKGVPIRVASQDDSRIHEIPLEEYLKGVLEKEVIGTWPIEALKAQAVASRTYALYRKEHPRDARFDMMADTSDQVFQKKSHHSPAVVRAVMETEGETLAFQGEIFQAYFHSCCGGKSERADRVWEEVKTPPLLTVREDAYCDACPRTRWDYRISRREVADILKKNGHNLDQDWKVEVSKRDESGRVAEIRFRSGGSDIELSGTKFREMIGYTKLPSTLFEIEDSDGDNVTFSGKGSGHGVGLCQWGAKGMAEEGKSYREILEFYYPGIELAHTASTEEVFVPEFLIPDPDLSQVDTE